MYGSEKSTVRILTRNWCPQSGTDTYGKNILLRYYSRIEMEKETIPLVSVPESGVSNRVRERTLRHEKRIKQVLTFL